MPDSSPRVYYPDTLNELLQICRRYPQGLLYAGGTYILSHRSGRFVELPPVVVSLQDVEELRRVSRSERVIEFGAGMTISEILALGEQNLPGAIYPALSSIGHPAVHGLATIGGNLAVPGRLMTSVAALILLDAKLEIRRQGGTRWTPVSRFHQPDATIDLAADEVITRIRVPTQPWSGHMFRRFGNELSPTSEPLTVSGLVRVSNGIVEEIRMSGIANGRTLLRSKTMEAELVGRRPPLSYREVESSMDAFGEMPESLSRLQKDRFQRLLTWFLLNLHRITRK